jgi:DNA invertase Pin-like site-specific DNA recombinase
VSAERTYVDHGLTGTNRERPGLRDALAACRSGDTLVVTKLDRLARSLPDAREILENLTRREVKLSIGGSTCWRWSPSLSPTSSGCARRRGCASRRPRDACVAGSPSSTPVRKRTLVALHRAGEHSTTELGDRFGVGRSTVYRAIERDTQRRQHEGSGRAGSTTSR